MTDSDDHLKSLLKDFIVAMLVTRTEEGELRSRPMTVVDIDSNGTLWLLTDRHSGKMDEIAKNSRVNVTMQSAAKFVSISGSASAADDRQKVSEFWSETWKVWFPKGQDDPDLVLIRIDASVGEYWDNQGTNGIRYLIEAGKAYLNGTRPNVAGDSRIHGKVDLG